MSGTPMWRRYLRFLRRDVRGDVEDELRSHLEMRTAELIESGMEPEVARAEALRQFGDVEQIEQELVAIGEGHERKAGLRHGLRISALDFKLGARMLARYPGVTVVGGLAMAIGVGLGAGYLEIVNDFIHPTLPFDEGERIAGIQNWNIAENDPELRSLHDFVDWREEVEAFETLGAFRSIERNLATTDAPGEPARGAEITPSAFQIVRVPPLLGRTLVDADELERAPQVIVLGYDLWRNRFGADPDVVGETVRLGTSTASVVGVMPEGFAFPMSHAFWVPLRPNAVAYERRQGPAIQIFGRLATGVSFEEAQAELRAMGLRAATEFPATHQHLRPRVMKYTELFVGGEGSAQAYWPGLIFVLLLLVLSLNVASMVFVRTATRENEIAMRLALGAGRGDIVLQFFIETLVLATAATIGGLALAAWGTSWVTRFFWDVTEGQIPFWLDRDLNLTTVAYAVVLAILASVVAGVMPALKVTGSRLQARLRHPGRVGDSALRFGGLWSGMIALQVAFAVLVLPLGVVAITTLAEDGQAEAGFPGEQYLSARIEMELDPPPADSAAQSAYFSTFQSAYQEVRRRLLDTPEVSRVTFASRLPRMNHPQPWMETDSSGGRAGLVMAAAVDIAFFETFGAQLVAGRGFNSSDVRSEARVVVVNEHFVSRILQGQNAIGRRVRHTSRYGERSAIGLPQGLPDELMRGPGPWYEIVGVVSNLGMDTNKDPFWSGRGPGMYHPLTPAAIGTAGFYSVRVAFHVRGSAVSFAPQFREIAHAVHPGLRVHDVLPLDRPVDRANRGEQRMSRFFSWAATLFASLALLISVAGVYSVLAFTVSRQTREIGLRIALGADRRRIITGVFSRSMAQIGAGLIVGTLIWFHFIVNVLGGVGVGSETGLFAATAAVLLVVGLAACGIPIARALRIEPAEALRDGG